MTEGDDTNTDSTDNESKRKAEGTIRTNRRDFMRVAGTAAAGVGAGVASSGTAVAAPDAVIAEASSVPTMDGTVDDVWADANAFTIGNVISGSIGSDSDLSAEWRALWDADDLYYLVTVTDDSVTNDGSTNPWDDDSVEIHVDAGGEATTSYDSNDYQLVFRYDDGSVYTGTNSQTDTTGIQHATSASSSGYRLEVSIPWSTLGVSPSDGHQIGTDVHVNDDDGGGGRDGKMAWYATSDDSWADPSTFGTAELSSSSSDNQAPTARFTATPREGDRPLEVEFDAGDSSDPDDGIWSYDWEFGDGEVGNGLNVTHTYESAGDFTATLTVEDKSGATDSTSKTISVYQNADPTVSLDSPSDGATYQEGDDVPLEASASDSDGSVARVVFYANGSQIGEATTSPYAATWTNAPEGTYDVTAEAVDDAGATATSTPASITVEGSANSAPTASFTASPTSGSPPLDVSFDASGSSDSDGSIASYDWDFGDGATGSGQTITHTYDAEGSFEATLTVTDDAGAADSSATVIDVANEITEQLVYHVGNSVTDTVNYSGLNGLAEGEGKNHDWGRHVIPGAPLSWNWDHPDDGFTSNGYGQYDEALPNYAFDSLVLQPYDRGVASDVDYGGRFFDLALNGNPDVQCYIKAFWPRKNHDGWGMDWEGQWTADTSTNTSKAFFEAVADGITSNFPNQKRVLLVPTGHVMHALLDDINAGNVPGIASPWDFYEDGVHLNDKGAYVDAITHFTTLYKEDPRGLPTGEYSVTQEFADVVQQNAWDALRSYGYTGVGGGSGGSGGSTPTGQGEIGREFWTNVGGTMISDNDWTTAPDQTDTTTAGLQGRRDWGDDYATRIEGTITAPEDGDYQFWIASDDNAELYLSTDSTAANASKIAAVGGWTSWQEWNKYTSQQSTTQTLTAGQEYYVKVLHKEGTGGDHVEVGWRKPSDGSGTSPTELVPGKQLSTYDSTPTGQGEIVREYWTGVTGTTVADIPTDTSPDGTETLTTSLEGPVDWADDYGTRIEGYVTAPEDGDYTFWIASDDNSELHLSTDDTAANASVIASVDGWTSYQEWNKYASQQSSVISLTEGQDYYVKVLHKEGTGGDNVSVGWRKPSDGTGSSPAEIVPAEQLSPADSSGGGGSTSEPIPAKGEWTASTNGGTPGSWGGVANAIDGDESSTFYSTSPVSGTTLAVDMGSQGTVSEFEMTPGSEAHRHANGFAVEVSDDGTSWTQVVTGTGSTEGGVVTFSDVTARHVRVRLTEAPAADDYWCVAEAYLRNP